VPTKAAQTYYESTNIQGVPFATETNITVLFKHQGFMGLLKLHQQFTHSSTVRSAHTVFMCFVFIWEQTAICATYSIKWLVFITEMKSVYSAVQTGSLNKAVCASSLNGYLRTNSELCHLQHKLIGFITEIRSVYSAVRTVSLNKAVCAWSLNGYLRTNSDLCHLQHKLVGFYNRDEKCLQRGKDWVFK
jgi:hypothetical protein